MWNYYWGYTKAQIELLVCDAPLIVYDKDKNKPLSKKEADRFMKEWEEKNDGFKVSESEALDFNSYLSGKVEKFKKDEIVNM